MALVEVDEAELQALKGHKALLDKLGADPNRRAKILPLLKEAFPNLAIPELDAAEGVRKPLEEKIAALQKSIADDREAREKAQKEAESKKRTTEIEDAIASGRKLLKSRGYAKETIEEVEKMMESRGLIDYEAAEALWAKDHPDGEPIASVQNWTTASDLMYPPEDSPWAKVIEAGHKGGKRAAELAAKRVQNAELSKGLLELRGQQRARV